MESTVATANNQYRDDNLRQLELAHLRGDAIVSVQPVECGPTILEINSPPSQARRGLHAGQNLSQRFKKVVLGRKMNLLKIFKNFLKIFQSDEARIKDDRFKNFVSLKLENYLEGYPRLAAFIDSDVDNVMFRRFGILHARLLLYKQAEMTELEEQLQELDKSDEHTLNDWRLHSHINLSRGDNKLRKGLMEKIEGKMKDYDELILRDHQIRNLRKPSRRLHKSVFNYIYNWHPVTKEDEHFIYHRDDFVCLSDHVEFNWLDDIIHKFMDYDQSNLLRRICTTEEDRNRTTDPDIRYYSRSRLGVFMRTFIAFVSTILLLIPVYLLITVTMDMQKMATVVLGFVFLFAAALSIFTDARRLDVFLATATYSAVLCVFLGNLQQGQAVEKR